MNRPFCTDINSPIGRSTQFKTMSKVFKAAKDKKGEPEEYLADIVCDDCNDTVVNCKHFNYFAWHTLCFRHPGRFDSPELDAIWEKYKYQLED